MRDSMEPPGHAPRLTLSRLAAACACFIVLVYINNWSRYTSRLHLPDTLNEEYRLGNLRAAWREQGSNELSPTSLDTYVQGLRGKIYDPYPDYKSRSWSDVWKGSYAACVGPSGRLVNKKSSDLLLAHRLNDEDTSFRPLLGSLVETGQDSRICFDSRSRYDPYGIVDTESVNSIGRSRLNWDEIDWAQLQSDCTLRNRDRYEDVSKLEEGVRFRYPTQRDIDNVDEVLYFPDSPSLHAERSRKPRSKSRSAVVFQINESRGWTIDTIQYIRSMIMELALPTGGEYEIIILVEVERKGERVMRQPDLYQKALRRAVPKEFRNIAFLYHRSILEAWYERTRSMNDDQRLHLYQPLQLLSVLRPDLEFFWQMDMDARYTGHHYEHLERVSSWAQAQPRDLLWERASQVFVPAVHKTWDNFSRMVAKDGAPGKVDGPVHIEGIEPVTIGKTPGVGGREVSGVGQQADLITFSSLFDPSQSKFESRNVLSNYPGGIQQTPRRATAPWTMARVSKRLLRAMHHGQVDLGTYMAPAMFAASTALHHGLKAVAYPLPVFSNDTTSSEEIERAFNANWGQDTYDWPSQHGHIWSQLSYGPQMSEKPTFADYLYKRWLSYDDGNTQGLCLPGILLHPIEGV